MPLIVATHAVFRLLADNVTVSVKFLQWLMDFSDVFDS